MFPDSNAPKESQPWVREVTTRADATRRAAASTESNAYSLSASAKSSYELIDNRIANIGSFTTGLFEQGRYFYRVDNYSELAGLQSLYNYADGSFQEYAAVTKRIPFAQYNELTVTADAEWHGYTTDNTSASISEVRPLRPMIMATIPPLPRMSASGAYTPNGTTYASRWTVENFEPFLDYDIPGNVVASAFSATYGQDLGYYPNAPAQIKVSRDGYTGYSMKYTRQWLTEYMLAIRDYTMENSPPAAGSYYLPPDVNQIEIVLGWYYRVYTSVTPTNDLHINDNRLIFTSGSTFIFEGIRNMGY